MKKPPNPRWAGIFGEKQLKNLVDSGIYVLIRRHKDQTQKASSRIKQTVLPFKGDVRKALITPHAGWRFWVNLSSDWDCRMRWTGYRASAHVLPLLLILKGGGRGLEDVRQIRDDRGLREVLEMRRIPSSNAVGDWMRQAGRTVRWKGWPG